MRAVILAAGEGRRLCPLTEERPKCLVEYQGRPILDYQLEVMNACGLRDIVLVKGHKAEAFQRYGLKSVLNPNYNVTNMVYTLFCAELYFNDDLVISYGDILYEKSILDALLASPFDFSVAVSMNWKELWLRRMPHPLTDAETLKMDAVNNILEVGKKPKSYDEIQGQYMGLLMIRKPMLKTVTSLYRELDRSALYDGKNFNQMYMTRFIQILIDRGHLIKAVKVTGEWLEIDRIEDLSVACNITTGVS